jgi:hypothetical protein
METGRAMPKQRKTFSNLEPRDRKWIASEIFRLRGKLKGRRRAWAYKLIDTMLWFWTADAVNSKKLIQRDAIKNSLDHLRHTVAARRSLEGGPKDDDDKVQHEHASERAELIALVEQPQVTEADVLKMLIKLNVAVLVTRKEHRALPTVAWDANWRKRAWDARHKKGTIKSPLKRG